MAKKTGYHDYLRQELSGLIEQLQLPELYKKSLKQRWLDQVIWADKKAAECRRWHYRLRLTTIVGSVILPALVGINFQFVGDDPFFRNWFPYLPFVLSQIIAVSAAAEEFCRFGDRWRDYRKMAEDLKAEGWQYLQLSGSYYYTQSDVAISEIQETIQTIVAQRSVPLSESVGNTEPLTHLKGYAMFANRVESIIKNDVESYVTQLAAQQAKQQQEIAKYLENAQSVSKETSVSGRTASNGGAVATDPAASNFSSMSVEFPTTYPSGNGHANRAVQITPTLASQLPSSPSPVAPPPPILVAPPPPSNLISPPLSPPPASSALPVPTRDLNAAIVESALAYQGQSTAAGPDGGNNACAWSLHQVLQRAGIAAIGSNSNYVPEVVNALKRGRGRVVSRREAKAGDLVVAYDDQHIGIGLTDGCTTVLSNSSSRACFGWESDTDFDRSYGGSSTIYRLLS